MITINRCGCNSNHKLPFEANYRSGYKDCLLLFIMTPAYFHIDNKYIEVSPNTVFLCKEHTPIHYGSKGIGFNDHWIHFTLDKEEDCLFEKISLPMNTPFFLPQMNSLNDLIYLIIGEHFSSHKYQTETIDALMHSLLFTVSSLYQASACPFCSNKFYEAFQHIHMKLINSPCERYDIDDFAKSLHISTSYFQHLYKEFFGVSCMQDIINTRISNSKYYLKTTEMSIHSLSVFLGYENENHFLRQFKKATGVTPSEYRKINR